MPPDFAINRSEREAVEVGALDLAEPPAAIETGHSPRLSRALVTRMGEVMAEARATFQQELARLTVCFGQASNREQALAVQREIEALKAELEVTFLEIQARYFREGGLIARADEFDALIDQIRSAEERPPASVLMPTVGQPDQPAQEAR
jgi:hypothetical protein